MKLPRQGPIVVAVALAVLAFAPPAGARVGALAQLPGKAGCVAQPDCCGLVISPNSGNLYATSSHRIVQVGTFEGESASFAIAAFATNVSGLPMQLTGGAGCVNRDGSDGCTAAAFKAADPVNEASGILISPNGRNVYVPHTSAAPDYEVDSCAGTDNFIAVLTRDSATGALDALRQDTGSCGVDAVMSPDGRSVYSAAGNFGNAMSLFSRSPRSGTLSRAGCIGFETPHCRPARHVRAPSAIAVTPNGRFTYVVSDDFNQGQTIGAFRRSLR
jgi:DNA-binding beta-propeller fold protein YncE